MAPFEIVPRNAQLIAAPLDGTIEHVLVAPGAAVTEGQLLLRFSGATLESRLDIAQHEVLVAEANLKQAAQLAFTEDRGRRDLATASSQVELKVAERDLARQLLSRTEVRAQKSGISMFTSPDDLIGRPVATGEKLMKVADPDQVEASLEVSLTDASLLQNGTHVRLFFDADPLNAQDAVLESAEYKPKPDASNVLSYRAVASLVGESLRPRLGARGTAQLVGHSASLAFVLLRRPLAALRQRIAM
jgi:multidrug resistance efflux pump